MILVDCNENIIISEKVWFSHQNAFQGIKEEDGKLGYNTTGPPSHYQRDTVIIEQIQRFIH